MVGTTATDGARRRSWSRCPAVRATAGFVSYSVSCRGKRPTVALEIRSGFRECRLELREREVPETRWIIEEMILEVGHDLVLPDQPQARLIEPGYEEEARANGTVAIGEARVRQIDHICDPRHLVGMAPEPAAQQTGHRRRVG